LTLTMSARPSVKSKTYAQMTDYEIIERCRVKDHSAFTELIRRYDPFLRTLLRDCRDGLMEIEDLRQEVLIRLFNALPKLQNPKLFKPWLIRIVTNLFYDSLRQKLRRGRHISIDSERDGEDGTEQEIKELVDPSLGPAALCELNEQTEQLLTSISAIPIQFKITLALREIKGMTYQEISQMMNVDLGTVKSRISRAKTKLLKMNEAA